VLNGDGIIHLKDRLPHNITIKLTDAAGNETRFDCTVQVGNVDVVDDSRARNVTRLAPNTSNTINSGDIRLFFAPSTLYDTVPFVWRSAPATGAHKASALITLHKPTVPLHNPYTVAVRTTLAANSALRYRTVMQLTNFKNKVVTKGKWQGNYMSASFNQFGTVQLLTDTMAPQVNTLGWPESQVFTGKEPLQLVCSDNLGSIARFRAALDGKWLLFSQKGHVFTYVFDKRCAPGRHWLTVQVTDVAGNVTRQRFSLVRQ
jgi:hypothetical protein